jgi:hypothetical protein
MKMTVASGGLAAKTRASSSTPAVPEPLSSQPGAVAWPSFVEIAS